MAMHTNITSSLNRWTGRTPSGRPSSGESPSDASRLQTPIRRATPTPTLPSIRDIALQWRSGPSIGRWRRTLEVICSEREKVMKKRDMELGMNRRISRRDFLNGVAVGVAGMSAGARLSALDWLLDGAEGKFPQDKPGYYPPTLTG